MLNPSRFADRTTVAVAALAALLARLTIPRRRVVPGGHHISILLMANRCAAHLKEKKHGIARAIVEGLHQGEIRAT